MQALLLIKGYAAHNRHASAAARKHAVRLIGWPAIACGVVRIYESLANGDRQCLP
jgi:hypothetical protein